MGLKAKCDVAKRPENKHKNRYGNIIACEYLHKCRYPFPTFFNSL